MSIGYGVLVLQTAYLKKYYPLQFFKAALNSIDKSKLSKYILDAKHNGIKIKHPNINNSESGFSIHNNEILFGLQSIKGLGEATVSQIISERNKNGKFKNYNDFSERCNPSDSLVITLVKAGAIPTKDKMDFLIKYADSKLEFSYKPVSTLPTLKKLENEWRIDTTVYDTKEKRLEIYNQKRLELEKIKFKDKKQNYIKTFAEKYLQDEDLWEFETLSTFINNNPFDEVYEDITPFNEIENGMSGVIVGVIAGITKKKDRNKNQFAYIQIYSSFGIEEVTCWSSQYSKYQDFIKKGSKIAVLCKKEDGKGFVNEMKTYEQWESDREKIVKRG